MQWWYDLFAHYSTSSYTLILPLTTFAVSLCSNPNGSGEGETAGVGVDIAENTIYVSRYPDSGSIDVICIGM